MSNDRAAHEVASAQELGTATWPSLARRRVIVLIPLGSCEQHGPHLPLDTDTRIAIAVAHRAAEHDAETVVAPAVNFGASWEHDGFPGLLSLNADVLCRVMVELVHSAGWAAGIVFVNGHGGNLAATAAAVKILQAEGRRARLWSPRYRNADAHAGRTETSMMLAIAPDLVRLADAEPGWKGSLESLRHQPVKALSPNGVLGDPSLADTGEGTALLDELADDLRAVIVDLTNELSAAPSTEWSAGPVSP